MIKGFTCGAFDPYHPGHAAMFEESKNYCDELIVGLQVDPSVDRKSKNKPVQTVFERLMVLRSIKYIDRIIVYETEEDLYNMLAIIKPDIRFVDETYKDEDITGFNLGIEIFKNNRKHNYSSSRLRKRYKEAK